jgi:NCS1 family nucleobase:cation symporter-1
MGALPSLPGFLVQVKAIKPEFVPPSVAHLYHYAWFIGFALAFVVYLAGRNLAGRRPPLA